MAATKPIIGIIILHYGKWEITMECLDSLHKLQSKQYRCYVVAIDNSGSLDSHKRLAAHPIVNLAVRAYSNMGFSGGNNLGIKHCQKKKCKYIVFLNNDTVVQNDFLSPMLQVSRVHPKFILGPVIEHCVREKTLYDYGGKIKWRKGQPDHINKFEYQKPKQMSHVVKRDFVSGCCMWVPTDVLEDIGGFDESYFLYLEDVELCLRAKTFGIHCAVVSASKIFHKGSQSSTEWIKIKYSLRNSLKLIWKYMPSQYKLSALVFSLCFYPALFVRWQLGHFKRQLISKF